MAQKTLFLTGICFLSLLLSGCGEGMDAAEDKTSDLNEETASEGDGGEYPYAYHEDDKMIGTAWTYHEDENYLSVGITEWERRDEKGPAFEDIGISYKAIITENTVIRHEDGTEVDLAAIKKGQKVQVNPPRDEDFEGIAEEIILLDMTYEEKYHEFLHGDGLYIGVIYNDSTAVPMEMQEPMFEKANEIMEGTGELVGAGWEEYDEEYVVDYKKEFEIERFPVILLFDEKQLLFKTYETAELYEFLEKLKREIDG